MNDFSIENYKQLSDKQKRELLRDKYFLFNKVISKYLTGHRYYHSISTAITASELAYAHHYPVNKAYVAGILHDITKQWSKEQSIEWLERFEPEYLNKIGTQEEEVLKDEIRKYVRTKLAHYKVPKFVMLLNEFPMNASGKIHLKVLKEMAEEEACRAQSGN